MDLLSSLALGFSVALDPINILYCFIGVLLGTLVGVLPGIGPTATIAMLLPITFTLGPETSLIMLAGIYYGAQYGGSTTAILINLPGESSSAVTAIDGYQMARKGRAGAALATAALGSFFAGTVATLLLAFFAPPLARAALNFGAPEYFSLIVLGLLVSIALAHGSILKALAMIVLGLLLGMVGQDIYTGTPRFTFGVRELFGGLNFVAVAVGVFGVAEILRNLENEKEREVGVSKVSGLWLTKDDIRRIIGPVLRGTALGSVLGVLPGGGHILSSFASYSAEKRLSKTPEEFGHGAIEGVAGPESANNAAAQTSFIPLMTLGIPAHPVMALMIGAFILQGITPGPNVINQEPALFWGIIASMWIGNLLLVILNLPLIGLWVKMLSIPYRVLFPAIVLFACIGTFSINQNIYDIYAIAFFGIVGYLLIRFGCEPAPLLLGFVLGPLLEEHLRRAMIISRGDPMIFIERPISATLLGLALLAVIVAVLPSIRKKRNEVFVEDD
ncbi:MAG: tripartite tricarboxylate transporter permease [Alphaproteobacteria bacterium]|jgi:TctA family transporter|uniref:tripartite tricarboxylate transporter permease n=1 Tax=Devosia sp. XGJD_8 TaxID=3391187 RepID=UPI001D817A67|nr:tripartite tricarboxylate transporter permease [Alphaproteobacteria bacterium]MBU1561003.1 tripartite tricarboxylate transporter permease [Alphaproteobacteria bacterium]MBU2304977.1 tripartite tricarboxylate transporter permease [Alphaproteobacteria bacterium]MBU2370229.1 tripartite tricarboxylate transporter permease [Alphaproteobacteria bacterium]